MVEPIASKRPYVDFNRASSDPSVRTLLRIDALNAVRRVIDRLESIAEAANDGDANPHCEASCSKLVASLCLLSSDVDAYFTLADPFALEIFCRPYQLYFAIDDVGAELCDVLTRKDWKSQPQTVLHLSRRVLKCYPDICREFGKAEGCFEAMVRGENGESSDQWLAAYFLTALAGQYDRAANSNFIHSCETEVTDHGETECRRRFEKLRRWWRELLALEKVAIRHLAILRETEEQEQETATFFLASELKVPDSIHLCDDLCGNRRLVFPGLDDTDKNAIAYISEELLFEAACCLSPQENEISAGGADCSDDHFPFDFVGPETPDTDVPNEDTRTLLDWIDQHGGWVSQWRSLIEVDARWCQKADKTDDDVVLAFKKGAKDSNEGRATTTVSDLKRARRVLKEAVARKRRRKQNSIS